MKSIKKEYLTENKFKGIEFLAALGISLLAKELVKKGWKKVAKTPPPENPYSSKASIKEVILFSVSLALVSTSIKLLTRHKLAAKWDRMDGALPKELK